MSSNIIVKIILGVLVLAALMLGLTKCQEPATEAEDGLPQIGGEAIDEETRKKLGIEGDTPEDTVRTLISNVLQQNKQLKKLEEDNNQLKRNNDSFLNMEENLFSKLRSELASEANTIKDSNRKEMDSSKLQMQKLLDRIRSQAREDSGSAPPTMNAQLPGSTVDPDGTVWVGPLDVSQGSGLAGNIRGGLSSLPWDKGGSGVGGLGASQQTQVNTSNDPDAFITPAYTVAKNSTMVGATAFTALIGRVPVGNNIVDPYSFKVIIGKDNLIANGKEIPEMAYAVVSGKAVGDWTLGCVSGDVFSITFVFEDGRIRTLPKPKDISDGSSTTPDLKIGELSDDYGNPCVAGSKISNAGKYLAQRIAATAAGAAARAAAASETTTSVSSVGGLGVGGITVVDGNKGKFILDETLAGAASETAQWIRDRQALEFDAIYVEPGAKVAIHITEELKIDYDQKGRLTHHAGFSLGGNYRDLD